MTYDPRQGGSPYLGMDDHDSERSHSGATVVAAACETRMRPQTPRTTRIAPSGPAVETRAMRDDRAGHTVVRPAQRASDQGMRTIRRPAAAQRRRVAPQPQRRPVPAAAVPYATASPVAVPSPEQRPYLGNTVARRHRRGPLNLLGRLSLRLLALVMRLAALLLVALVGLSAFGADASRASLVSALNLSSLLVPSSLLGRYVVETPFGGTLRGDLALVSLALFVADWLCLLLAYGLRSDERGA